MTDESTHTERVTSVADLDEGDIVRVDGTEYRVQRPWCDPESWTGGWSVIIEECDAPPSASREERTELISDVPPSRSSVIIIGSLFDEIRGETVEVEVLRVASAEDVGDEA